MSEVALSAMTERDAEKLTERIRITAHNYAEARQKLYQLVQEAKEGNAHLALGYKSWTTYLAEVLGEEPMRLARGERQEMVRMLSDEGMSTRAIAPIVGAPRETVRRIIAESTDPNGSDDQHEPRVVESMDGRTRTYQPPPVVVDHETGEIDPPATAPAQQKRRPITDQARDAGWELRKAVERIQRLQDDDRYSKKETEVLGVLAPYMDFTLNTLTQIRN